MATINVYECYYKASLVVNGDERQGALVMLISTSEEGQFRYEAAVTFFPHRNDEDYAISYDAYFSKVLYEAKGRRSKKRESALLQKLQQHIDEIADNAGGKIFWNSPLREARVC
jgi:hypothetical protein